MRFNIAKDVPCFGPPRIGDVFPAKGGARRKIACWVVLAINPETGATILIGLNDKGDVTSATTYAAHVMELRTQIGRVEGLEDLEFNVEPLP